MRLCLFIAKRSAPVAFRTTVPSGGSTITSGESVGRIATRAASSPSSVRTITVSPRSTSVTGPVSKKYIRPAFMNLAPMTVRGTITRPP